MAISSDLGFSSPQVCMVSIVFRLSFLSLFTVLRYVLDSFPANRLTYLSLVL